MALGIPRGGALAFGERVGNDVARLAKMMIRPMGLGFIAKQALLHLMQPNTENEFGVETNYDDTTQVPSRFEGDKPISIKKLPRAVLNFILRRLSQRYLKYMKL